MKAQRAKEKEAKSNIRTLFEVGVKKVKAPGTVSTSSDNSPRQAPKAEAARKGCKLGWKLIMELEVAAERMGIEVPIAIERDAILDGRGQRLNARATQIEVWEIDWVTCAKGWR
ncbi:hypothetical protein K443DRAFT_12044 [Laccaria amethystina LaAM-08-1]|uniref:Unplaced genomic scaffold K443scaffold_254, whole genome shotgun sequence n=1 Tax=Laccaria amethystina LaAM-08-1 TaxID=1095629 RepID=A0A0C9WZX7_9AGAR|nr:hypothetical protein K443DRAFT_12044 [Laccaria amethystina LaAM-08-1]